MAAHVVIDNAHRDPPSDLEAIAARAPNLRILVAVPAGRGRDRTRSKARNKAETLNGWDEDTIAAALHDTDASRFADCERLSRLTGGLPFYVTTLQSWRRANMAGPSGFSVPMSKRKPYRRDRAGGHF